MAGLDFANIGNALAAGAGAAYSQGRSRREAEADRMRKDAQQYIQPALKGDQDAFGKLAANSPDTANSVATMLGRLDAGQRAKAKDAAEYTANAANAILQADPASRAAIYRQLRADGIQRGYNLGSLPEEYHPSLEPMLRTQRNMAIPILEQMKLEEGRPTPLGDAPAGGGGAFGNAISAVESGGRYDAVGPPADGKGSRAYGKYQVMDFNIGPWTQEILGKSMTPQEFMANPQAQDAVFNGKFGQYVQKYGSPQAASRAWFAGEGGMNNPNAKDVLGTSVAGYEKKFSANLPSAQMPGAPAGLTSNGPPMAQMPGAPQGLTRPGPAPAPIPQALGPGQIAQPPQVEQGDGGQVSPDGVKIRPEGSLQPEVRSVREIVRATRPGFRVMITPKTGLPIYDSQGRLYVQGPNGEPDYIEIPKAPTTPSGYRPAAGGGLEPIPGGPGDKPEGGLFGNSLTGRALQVLRSADPSSQEYAMAYGVLSKPQVFVDATGERREIQPMDLGMFQPPAFGRGGQPTGSPTPTPGATTAPLASGGTITTTPGSGPKPSPTEMGKLREMEAEGGSIIAALEDFKKEYKAAGVGDRLKSVSGANTPLNTSFSNAALLAKGEALYNLGVLNGPDLDIIRRTIPDPSSVRSAMVSPEEMEKSVNKVADLIKTRLAEKKKSLGVSAPADPATGGNNAKLLDDARQAIAKGAPREKVIERLRSMGVKDEP